MTTQEYIDKQIAQINTEFKEHKATILAGPPLEDAPVIIINWQKPGTWIYGCRFILHARWLTVVGDIGEAVYEWSETLKPVFFENMSLHYFLGKCQASEDGRRIDCWDNKVAAHNVQQMLKDAKEGEEDRLAEILTNLTEYGGDRDACKESAQEYYDDLGDGEAAERIECAGKVYHVRAIAHWLGLQMAVKQLAHAAKPEPKHRCGNY